MELSTEVEGEEAWTSDAAEEEALALKAEGRHLLRGRLPIHSPRIPTPNACFFSRLLSRHFSKSDALKRRPHHSRWVGASLFGLCNITCIQRVADNFSLFPESIRHNHSLSPRLDELHYCPELGESRHSL